MKVSGQLEQLVKKIERDENAYRRGRQSLLPDPSDMTATARAFFLEAKGSQETITAYLRCVMLQGLYWATCKPEGYPAMAAEKFTLPAVLEFKTRDFSPLNQTWHALLLLNRGIARHYAQDRSDPKEEVQTLLHKARRTLAEREFWCWYAVATIYLARQSQSQKRRAEYGKEALEHIHAHPDSHRLRAWTLRHLLGEGDGRMPRSGLWKAVPFPTPMARLSMRTDVFCHQQVIV